MAKSEILMWVAGIMMMIILGLAVAPTITKSGDTAKIAVINSEIQTLRQSANLWLSGSGNTTGDFTGLNAELLAPYLPGMRLTGTDANATLDSKSNSSIKYTIVPTSGNATKITIGITGLGNVSGAEASVNKTQTSIATAVTDTTANDGILSMDYQG